MLAGAVCEPQVVLDDQGVDLVRKPDLPLFSSAAQPVGADAVGLCRSLALIRKVFEQALVDELVEVVPAQLGVAVTGHDLNQVAVDVHDRDVERAAAQVEGEHDRGGRVMVRLVRQAGGCGFVDNPHHLQTGNAPRVTGCLALCVGEVRGHRDHGLLHRQAQVTFRTVLQLPQDHARDLRRRVLLVAEP